jgi:hypothetical protein
MYMKVGKDNKIERRKKLSTYEGRPKIRFQCVHFNLNGDQIDLICCRGL